MANDTLAARCAETDFGIVALLAKAAVLHHIYRNTPSALAIVTALFGQEPDAVVEARVCRYTDLRFVRPECRVADT